MYYLLFVYGTLQKGKEGHDQMSDAIFLGKTQTAPKYTKSKLQGDLVGLNNGKDSVRGELYAVTQNQLKQLDDYEYDIYDRRTVELKGGRTAFAYFLKNSKDEN